MEAGGAPIKKVKLYQCGYCVNHMTYILKHEKNRRLMFPAMVVFIRHEQYGNILFDTGYSRRIYHYGMVSRLYNLLNPTYVEREDTIRFRLRQENITSIDKIILSHAHPDHIGGLRDFRDYELIATKEVWKSMEHPHITELVFRNQIPGLISKRIAQPMKSRHFLADYFPEVYDLLGDGSVVGVRLDGHCNGQMGIYIEVFHLFFAADSSWGTAFTGKVQQMKWLPRRVQADFASYRQTIRRIQKLQREHREIQVIFSHEPFEERTYE